MASGVAREKSLIIMAIETISMTIKIWYCLAKETLQITDAVLLLAHA